MLKLISSPDSWHLFEDDPVRPHLTPNYRTAPGREAFVLEGEDGRPRAVICCAYTNQVPIDELELDEFSQAASADETTPPTTAVFYTVWSYDRGAGRDIVFAAQQHTQTRGCTRWVTLSPLTEMAERFHTKNGASLIARGTTCQNFEYYA